MPRRCTVCNHSDRLEIDRELSAGGDIPTLAAFHGVSTDALHRHKRNHLLPEQVERLALDHELADVDVLAEMRALYRRMKDFLGRAEEADNWPAVKAFHAEARKDLELLAKLLGELDDAPALNVLIAPGVQAAILRALAPHPSAKLAVAEALAELEDGAA